MRALALAVLLSILCSSSAAFAGGDVCLQDDANDNVFVLKNLRVPKRPGSALPVAGIGLVAGAPSSWPLSGTVIRDFDGDVLVGLTRYFDRCLLGLVLDENMNGTVNYDCNLDASTDMTSTVEPIACQ